MPLKYAGVVELVDSMDLGSITLVVCGFEPRRPHQTERVLFFEQFYRKAGLIIFESPTKRFDVMYF